jgi:hypothetical protein
MVALTSSIVMTVLTGAAALPCHIATVSYRTNSVRCSAVSVVALVLAPSPTSLGSCNPHKSGNVFIELR